MNSYVGFGGGRASRSRGVVIGVVLAAVALSGAAAHGQVASQQEISSLRGMSGSLADFDLFGSALAPIGDFDGDGIEELAVGALGDDDGGAVWILFLDSSANVRVKREISAGNGGFTGTALQGYAVASLGDFDGDGVTDIAVGAPNDALGGSVYILYLMPEGSVKSHLRIAQGLDGFSGPVSPGDRFGSGVAALGDVNGDGVPDLAVGADSDCPFMAGCGAVWILFLNADGTVGGEQKISATEGGLVGPLGGSDRFGSSVAALGDLDGDGVPDLAVGAIGDSSGPVQAGAVWVLRLASDGTVAGEQRISAVEGGFTGALDPGDFFGSALADVGDLDGNGVDEIVVGATGDDDGGSGRGAVWLLFLEADGTVLAERKISSLAGGFGGALGDGDAFGQAVASVGDVDGDSIADLAVGAPQADAGGTNRGAVWILTMEPTAPASAVVRNSLTNPESFHELSPAAIGTDWRTTVDIAAAGASASVVAVVAAGPATVPTPFGDVLIDLSAGMLGNLSFAAGSHSIPIPHQLALVGSRIYAQSATFSGPGTLELDNALDVVIGSF